MSKITFLGAGSTVFVKNIIGDSMLSPALCDAHIALYDIDATRLKESQMMLSNLNDNINEGRAKITAHLGKGNRKEALRGADYVVNAIQVGGYKPSTVIDFEIPKKYKLRQTIADTLGIGGVFRGLRTIPVMQEFARDMEEVCPEAWFLNYSNPMAILTGAMLLGSSIKTVGLCHSVQACATGLFWKLDMDGTLSKIKNLSWKIAGINHMAWLLELKDGDRDLYPMVKKRSLDLIAKVQKKGTQNVIREAMATAKKTGGYWWDVPGLVRPASDMVRLEMMRHFGYYVTESSEHNAEYTPYWIKSGQPDLVKDFNIPLDEYLRRCKDQIRTWKKRSKSLVKDKKLSHTRTHEYGSYIMEAIETDVPFRIHGNVLNHGLIPNLPAKSCVEVPCLVDRNGVSPCYVGDLPEQCAALNRTNINVQLLTIEAALTRSRDKVYQAAYLDPHTAAELSLDQIRSLCDELIKAHGNYLPKYV